jgi:hypothetical protein
VVAALWAGWGGEVGEFVAAGEAGVGMAAAPNDERFAGEKNRRNVEREKNWPKRDARVRAF